ncbi:MAG: septal ring lytic transglycosylase RlpA family protein [Bryobacteraceae bacterium]|nr:septal ring lytic transglycosylase RlpA family protein [Bryobacteraceae bacterium]
MPVRCTAAICIVLLALISACAKKKTAVTVPSPPGVAASPPVGYIEEGIASWYGHPYHGRAAANGEIYDMEKLTAAHRTLPFGTWLRVDNLANDKNVIVRINDRGPFVDGRIIDLSRAAARQIDMIGPGTARVRLTVTPRPPDAPRDDFYRVQIGAFRDRDRAQEFRDKAAARFPDAEITTAPSRPLYMVLVGPPLSLDEANHFARQVRAQFGPAVVVRTVSE